MTRAPRNTNMPNLTQHLRGGEGKSHLGEELPRFVRDLLASPPARGEGLNNWFFKLARVLHPHRDEAEIEQLLRAATAGQPLQRTEIRRAIESSKAVAWNPDARRGATHLLPGGFTPSRQWPRINSEQREAIVQSGLGLVDLWEASPLRFEDEASHADEVIDILFPGNPLLCVGRSKSEFATRPREEWRGRLGKMQLIVPSPMSARIGKTQKGTLSEHSLENTGPRRFLIVEQDGGHADEQAAVLLHLAERAPLALAVHSGSKSIHGWFMAAGQPEERLLQFMRDAVALGADRATWTRSQFVRMPDGTRDNGSRQTVYFFDPEVIQ